MPLRFPDAGGHWQITPDGKLAIVNNIGGGQDGQADTVGIIDLEANPPRVIDQVVVGWPGRACRQSDRRLCRLADPKRHWRRTQNRLLPA